MIRRFCTSEKKHKTKLTLLRCGLRIAAALALAFVMVGVNPSGSAQAAPAYSFYTFNMVVVPSALYVCENESMTFKVSIETQLQNLPGDTDSRHRRAQGMMIIAELMAGAKSITPSESFIGNPRSLDPYSVTFTFKAGNAAQTTRLRFSTQVSAFWYDNSPVYENESAQIMGQDVNIEIRKCSYKVNTFFVGLAPEIMSWAYAADETILNKDSDTQFSGSVPFHRVEKALFHDRGLGPGEILCSKKPYRLGKWTIKTEPTLIDYKADILVNGTLHLTTSLRNYKDIVSESCTGATSSSEQWLSSGSTPTTILSFPPEGGVAVVNGPVGDALFIVERVALPEQ